MAGCGEWTFKALSRQHKAEGLDENEKRDAIRGTKNYLFAFALNVALGLSVRGIVFAFESSFKFIPPNDSRSSVIFLPVIVRILLD
jgi:hypothetical protein